MYKRKRRAWLGLLAVAAVLLLIALAALAYKMAAGDVPVFGVVTEPGEDWRLTLVNRWHPLPEGYAVTTVTLANGQQVDSRIYPALEQMLSDMEKDGVYAVVASGYRTQAAQQRIFDETYRDYLSQGYSEADARAETERWVAVPGTSEHQLGLGVDINADGIHSYGAEVYAWLAENAHRYGFIYRYPEEKADITGIAAEPWHYRYVGRSAAEEIHARGVCLEEYLEGLQGGK